MPTTSPFRKSSSFLCTMLPHLAKRDFVCGYRTGYSHLIVESLIFVALVYNLHSWESNSKRKENPSKVY